MTPAQNFFMVSGVLTWGVLVASILGFIAYLVLKGVPDPQPKGKTVSLTGYKRYNKEGRLK